MWDRDHLNMRCSDVRNGFENVAQLCFSELEDFLRAEIN